jgi:uncharacterized protein (DUF1015 family)
VAAPPYDVVSRAEATEIAAGNPFSFLRVGRSEIDLPEVDAYDQRVYDRARDNLRAFMADGTLIQEREPALYLYELTLDGRSQAGIVGCVHVDDYQQDVIRKHERTRPDKEADRTRHILELRAHAEPVFLTYDGHPIIERLNAKEMRATPLYDLATDGVRHRVWRIERAEDYADAVRRIGVTYVADGHHRCASAARAADQLRRRASRPSGREEYLWFPAALFPTGQLRVLGYHRVVRDLRKQTPDQVLDRLGRLGRLAPTSQPLPDRPGVFGVYLDRTWYRLELDPATVPENDPVKSLDAQLLSDLVLEPILGIADIRNDPRIDFVGGVRGIDELVRRVDDGGMAIGFALYPVAIEQVMTVADGGGVMPPKSTWFEPKLASGLFVHTFD